MAHWTLTLGKMGFYLYKIKIMQAYRNVSTLPSIAKEESL